MSANEPSFDKDASPWSIKEAPGRAVYISGEYHALENPEQRADYARQARHIAKRAIDAMQMDKRLAFETSVVIGELAANALQYSGKLSELDVVYLAGEGAETVYVVAVNPAADAERAPGIEQAGRHVAEVGNDVAEHGCGLGMIEAYTDGQWDQRNLPGIDGRPQIITYAILHAGLPLSSNGDDTDAPPQAA